jgi:hypothetical protein
MALEIETKILIVIKMILDVCDFGVPFISSQI